MLIMSASLYGHAVRRVTGANRWLEGAAPAHGSACVAPRHLTALPDTPPGCRSGLPGSRGAEFRCGPRTHEARRTTYHSRGDTTCVPSTTSAHHRSGSSRCQNGTVSARNDDLPADLPVDLHAVWQSRINDNAERLEGLLARYRERHRRYHTTTHVAWVIRHVEDLSVDESLTDIGAVVAAAFYHDAIYEPRYPANERASARLASRDLDQLGWAEQRIDAVVAMIEATQGHIDPPNTDTGALFDADLAILGAEPDEYQSYVKAVRSEYRHLDDNEWSVGRGQVLQGFIDRETIFATRSGRSRWEQAARVNLTAELESVS